MYLRCRHDGYEHAASLLVASPCRRSLLLSFKILFASPHAAWQHVQELHHDALELIMYHLVVFDAGRQARAQVYRKDAQQPS